MCYNIAYIEKRLETLARRYHAQITDKNKIHLPVHHVSAFAHPYWPVITSEAPEEIRFYQWGLIPFFIKDLPSALKIRNQTANCIGEEAFEKPSFRMPIRQHRCLVPVSGFYEWRTEGKAKYPYYIYGAHQETLSLAGVYDYWQDPSSGDTLATFSIVTCKANNLLSKIHNEKKRMPLILKAEDEKLWLNADAEKDAILSLVKPLDDEALSAHTISKLITDKKQNSNAEEVYKPYEYPELQLLDM